MCTYVIINCIKYCNTSFANLKRLGTLFTLSIILREFNFHATCIESIFTTKFNTF